MRIGLYVMLVIFCFHINLNVLAANDKRTNQDRIVGWLDQWKSSWIIYPIVYVTGNKYVPTRIKYDYNTKVAQDTKLDDWLSKQIISYHDYNIYWNSENIRTLHVDKYTSNPLHTAMVAAVGQLNVQDNVTSGSESLVGLLAISPNIKYVESEFDINEKMKESFRGKTRIKFAEMAEQEIKNQNKKIRMQPPKQIYFMVSSINMGSSPLVVSAIIQEGEIEGATHADKKCWIEQLCATSYELDKPKVLLNWHKFLTEKDEFVKVIHINLLDLDDDKENEIIVEWSGSEGNWYEIYNLRKGVYEPTFKSDVLSISY